MPRTTRPPRPPPPDPFTLYSCRACGAWDLAPEEIVPNFKRCPGRKDVGHIDRVVAEAVRVEPYRP